MSEKLSTPILDEIDRTNIWLSAAKKQTCEKCGSTLYLLPDKLLPKCPVCDPVVN